MIDTDKYEGHTEGEWDLHSMGDGWTIGQLRKIDRTLMQDAPLLLAEVKRLRKENDVLAEAIKEDNEILKKHIETLAEVKRLRMIVARLEDARVESASMYDRPKLFHAVREIYEQRLQDIYQEKREEERT